MTMQTPKYAADDYAMDAHLRFEDLVDRNALDELGKSVYSLFGIPLRIFSEEGAILSDATSQQEVCGYVNTLMPGRSACASTVSAAKGKDPGEGGETDHPCFTGASYKIVAINYDGRRIGKMVIGPYLPAAVAEVPKTFLTIDSGVDAARAKSLLFRMPRVKPDTIGRIAKHVKAALDLIFFSGHKTLLTSQMHLTSVTASYHELEEKNARLQEAYDRLKELDRLKSNFLATVSHELRTPLTSIIGYSEMLTEGIAGPMSAEQNDFVHTIHEKGEHLLGLIMSLLDLSKLESGTMNMRKKAFVLAPVLHEVLTTVIPTARKKGVDVVIDSEGVLPELRGDPERMRQVVLNLVDNAVKFTPKGGKVMMRVRPVTITAPGTDDDDSGSAFFAPSKPGIEIRVLDTGIGIPEKERPRVFDAFYQVDSSSTREYGGAGLGLAIVKRLVEAHGGTITVGANTPQGTMFAVVLPASTGVSVAPSAGNA
jgi:two-component system, NarL family, sensor histidine kinase BarA